MGEDEEQPGAFGGARSGNRVVTPAIAVSLVILVASAALAMSYVAARGGLQLPVTPLPPLAVASPSESMSVPISTPIPTPSPVSTPTGEPSAIPTVVPTAASTPTPTLSPTATPAPTSDRYALLTPCPSVSSCYLYTVRNGDNLRSIANYFGVDYQTVLTLNPGIVDPATIQPGFVLVLPPPTR